MLIKVLYIVISTFGRVGIAVFRIHRSLLAQGVNSRMLVSGTDKTESGVSVEPYGTFNRFKETNFQNIIQTIIQKSFFVR